MLDIEEEQKQDQKTDLDINLTFKPFEMFENKEDAKEQKQAEQNRFVTYEFDINHEIQELIKRYTGSINMEYGTSGMDDLSIKEVFGQRNKYVFS